MWNAQQQRMLMTITFHFCKHEVATILLHCPITSMMGTVILVLKSGWFINGEIGID